MKLAGLSFSDVRGFADKRFEFASDAAARPHDIVLVTGPPAAGKTRFLEAILAGLEVVGPYVGIVRGRDWVYDGRVATIGLSLWLDDDERQLTEVPRGPVHAFARLSAEGLAAQVDRKVARLVSRYGHDRETSKREYFPDNRQNAWGLRIDGLSPMEQSLLRPGRDSQKYSFLANFLGALRDDPARARLFAERLELLSPTVRYAPAADVDPTICFRSKKMAGARGAAQDREPPGSGMLAPVRGLSMAEGDAVLIAATATLINLDRSIVLFDTPELYVPENRIVAFVQALLKLGHDSQWIIATESPTLLASAGPSAVIQVEPSAQEVA